MPVRVDSMFILADDLCGAADCAVGGAKTGLKSIVLLDHTVNESAQVVAVDADSRYRTPAVSRAINLAIWRSHSAPGRLFYKKIDSTLRGNFATDTSSLVGAGVAIVAPAFPQAGRTVREGRAFVKGVPLERTEIWSNERMHGEAELVAMLRAEGVSALNVPLETVRGDLRRELARLVSGGQVQAVVCDAEEDDDLAAIAGASLGLPVYWVGFCGPRGPSAASSRTGGPCLAAAPRGQRANRDGRWQSVGRLPPAGAGSGISRGPLRVCTDSGGSADRRGPSALAVPARPGWPGAVRREGCDDPYRGRATRRSRRGTRAVRVARPPAHGCGSTRWSAGGNRGRNGARPSGGARHSGPAADSGSRARDSAVPGPGATVDPGHHEGWRLRFVRGTAPLL